VEHLRRKEQAIAQALQEDGASMDEKINASRHGVQNDINHADFELDQEHEPMDFQDGSHGPDLENDAQPDETAANEIGAEELALIELVVRFYNLANENGLSNNSISKILSWGFGLEDSVAATICPKWREISKKYCIPSSCDQVSPLSSVQMASRPFDMSCFATNATNVHSHSSSMLGV
jgi:hypothetical protein